MCERHQLARLLDEPDSRAQGAARVGWQGVSGCVGVAPLAAPLASSARRRSSTHHGRSDLAACACCGCCCSAGAMPVMAWASNGGLDGGLARAQVATSCTVDRGRTAAPAARDPAQRVARCPCTELSPVTQGSSFMPSGATRLRLLTRVPGGTTRSKKTFQASQQHSSFTPTSPRRSQHRQHCATACWCIASR